MKYRLLIFIFLCTTILVGIIYSCGELGVDEKRQKAKFGKIEKKDFVGDQSCKSCHAAEFKGWKESHHDYAMRKADSSTVRGDFGNVTINEDGETFRFFRKKGRYMVEAPDSTGEPNIFEITHTFGWEPLQQYLIEYGRGKLQALNIAWNTEKKEWFSMHPDQKVRPGDWMHWTGGAMNWNTMCADCHSTQLEQNYIPEADSFQTTWTSINVSCESCHGPGREHVEFMQSGNPQKASQKRIREDLEMTAVATQEQQITTCARCHSLREKLVDEYDHENDFMDHYNPNLPHPEMYFADGQIKEEVYVYGSFLQSKMYDQGIKCNDCHDPHSLELKANVKDNSLCMSCHEPRYNTPKHTFHEPNTEASQCINCHMPGRYYMEVDFRRDHSFRVPRPDLSAQFGNPNACNSCHEDKSAEWAAIAVENWYGPTRSDHFSETLLKADSLGADANRDLRNLLTDTLQPDIARATAIWYMSQFPVRQNSELIKKYLESESPLIRKSAVEALAALPSDQKKNILAEALDDSMKAVRVLAARGLSEINISEIVPGIKPDFKQAMNEYRTYLDVNRYFPSGLMNRGQYFEKQGETDKAIEAYQKALSKDPHMNPARLNLAYLYNKRGNKQKAQELLEKVIEQESKFGPAHFSLGLLVAERVSLEKALPHFKMAAKLMPDHARIRYNIAVSYQQMNQPQKAEEWYLKAINIAPENPDYRYGVCTLYLQQNQPEKALLHARKLTELQPNNRQFQRVLNMVKSRLQ